MYIMVMNKIILDIEYNKGGYGQVFGIAGLRDPRVRPFFRTGEGLTEEQRRRILSEMAGDSAYVSCSFFRPDHTEADFNLGLAAFPDRPKEDILVRMLLYLSRHGYSVSVNGVEKGVDLPAEPFGHPSIRLGVSTGLADGPDGTLDAGKAVRLWAVVSGLYDILLS